MTSLRAVTMIVVALMPTVSCTSEKMLPHPCLAP